MSSLPTPYSSLHAALHAAAQPRLSKVALIHESGDVTFGQLLEKIDNVARHLLAMGIQRGDHFAIFGQNTLEHYYCMYAASKIGAVIVPLNPNLTNDEVAFSFKDSASKFMFIADNVDPAQQTLIPSDKMVPVSKLRAIAPGNDDAGVEIDPDADFIIGYSSGTTGTPKAIVINQGSMVRVGVSGAMMWGTDENDVTLIALPLGYFFGLNTATAPVLHQGGTVIVMRRFHPGEALDLFQKHGVTFFMGVPTMFTMFMEYCNQRELSIDLSKMKMLIASGSPLPPETAIRFRQQFGKRLDNYYAMSEAFPILAHYANQAGDPPENSTGRLAPGAQIEILREDGTPCADGEPGEAFVRGPAMLTRYNNNPELTAAAMRGNMFRTGDIMVRNADGFYTVTGRIKDIIIRGGHNISPAEVEGVLAKHPAVHESSVVGVPHEKYGEEPFAFVVLVPGETASAEELERHVAASLSDFKVPRNILFLEEFPHGKTGKVDKKKLRELAIEHLASRV